MRLNKKETGRQLVHLSGLALVYIIILGKDLALLISLGLAAFLFLIGIYKGIRHYIRNSTPFRIKLFEQIEDAFFDVVDSLDRKGYFPYYGAFTFYLGSSVVLILFPTEISILAITVLAVQDSFSTLMGVHFGKHEIFSGKTLEGSLSGFITAFFACALLTDIGIAFVAAAVGTLIEVLPVRIDDNITIPIGVAIVLSLI